MVFRSFINTPGGQSGLYGHGTITDTSNNSYSTSTSIAHGYAYKDPLPFNSWWHHEFAHNIFDCAHFFNNNNTCGNRWYAKQGWGFMGGGESPFETVLGWEAWWMGWLEPTTISSDTTITISDFVTQGEALRIAMPHTDGNHYLWIENHQMIDSFDQRFYYKDYVASSPGLYAYITSRCADRTSPSDMGVTGANAGMITVLNANGNYDFNWDKVTKTFVPGTGGDRHVLSRHLSNPISGQNDFQVIRDDTDTNGTIITSFHGNSASNEQMLFFAEWENDSIVLTYSNAGRSHVAFQVGDKIGLSGTVPALNQPVYSISDLRFEPHTLNGLSVEVIGYNATTGEYTVDISFNDWTVTEDKRWCGDIIQPAGSTLILSDTVEVVLDKSGTPNRHLKDSIHGFVNPTNYLIQDSATLRLESKACLRIKDYSTLQVNGAIELQDSALIVVDSTGVLSLNTESLTLNGTRATVIIKSGGTLRTADSVDLTFSGSGYLQFHAGAIADLGNNSRLLLAGSGTSDTLLWLHPNAVIDIDSHAIDIRQGTIVQQSGAQLVHQQAASYLLNVDFRGNNGLGYKAVTAPQVELYHTRFYDHTDGVTITDIDSAKGNFITISNGTFSNISNNAIDLERIQRRVQVSNTTISNSDGLYGIKADSVAQLALHHSTIGSMTTGIHHTGGGGTAIQFYA